MRARRFVLAGVVAVAIAPNASADANSLNDTLGPVVVGQGEVGRADARGSSATTLNPAGLSLARQVVFEGSYGYRPTDGASAINVSACDSTVPVAGCFYYRFFEANPEVGPMKYDRSLHEFGSTLSRALAESILVGMNFRYYDYDSELTGESDKRGFTFDAGAVIRPADALQIGVVGYNLLPQDTPEYPTALGTGITLRPAGALSLGFDGLWSFDRPDDQDIGRYGAGAEYFFASQDRQSGFPVRAGYVYDNGFKASYVTGGLGYINSKIAFDVGVRKQVSGGDELMLQAGLRFFGPAVR